jgi:hypothetical protein
MKQHRLITGARVGQILTGAVLLLSLTAPTTLPRAQALHEIMGGSVGRFAEDIFECGRQRRETKPCGLSYRFYAVDLPAEVNSPAMSPRGFAAFRETRGLYVAQPAHTGNFPEASLLGPGHVWHLLWDGVRDAETPGHIGYYAAASQVVNRGELGNPYSATCLPVTGQYACFGQIGDKEAHASFGTPLGDLPPIGGLSPIPVPIMQRNGLDKIAIFWEQATDQISRDGAGLPITGYQLYVYPNPINPPTEKELADKAIKVGDVIPVDTTMWEIDRATADMKDTVTLSAALKLVYGGGLESMYFSANGPMTGLAFPDTAATHEMDDAATGSGGVGRNIDIEQIFLETRQVAGAAGVDQSYFLATVDVIGEPDGQLVDGTRIRVFIDFNEEGLASTFEEPGKKDTIDITLEASVAAKDGSSAAVTFSGLGGIDAHSRLAGNGRVTFAVPLAGVLDAADNDMLRAADAGGGRRQILVWAETSLGDDTDVVPNTNDGKAPTVAGEVIKFSFAVEDASAADPS